MTHKNRYPSTVERIYHSKLARVTAVALAATIAAGCGSSSTPNQAGKAGRASAVAVGTRSPGPAPAPSSPASSPAAKTGAMPLSEMCHADNKIIDTKFGFYQYVNPEDDCTVPATPATPGDPILRWDIGQFSLTVDKISGLGGQFMNNYEQSGSVQKFTVGGDEGIVEPGVARIDVQLADGTIAQMEAQGPAVTPARTVPAMIAAASILLNLNGLQPYSTPIG